MYVHKYKMNAQLITKVYKVPDKGPCKYNFCELYLFLLFLTAKCLYDIAFVCQLVCLTPLSHRNCLHKAILLRSKKKCKAHTKRFILCNLLSNSQLSILI